VFPADRVDLAVRYAELLASDGVVRGLIGPREAPRLWDRHLVNSALLAQLVPADATVADLGSGAGLPGMVLALARPDLRVTLVEPLLRRTTFLDEVVRELGLTTVEVVRARAESLHGARRFDVVTARALAPLDRLLGWAMPLVAPDGALVAMKGAGAEDEVVAAGPVLARLGCAAPELVTLDAPGASSPTRAVRVAWADPAQVSWPLAQGPEGGTGRRRASRSRRTTNRRRRT
jgi:16S rRNA (guanine527-N7)-methyltransferase